MKKTVILFIILLFIILAIALLAIEIQGNRNKKDLLDNKLSSIPSIEVYDLSNTPVKLDSLSTREKTIIVCFDTSCDICHIEARDYCRLQDKFEDSRVIFISNNSIKEIRQFISDNGLENSDYVFLNDRNYQLVKNYDIPTIPFMLLYIDNKLYKSYKGGINIGQIIKDKNDRQS